jgi:uncharacterized protein
LSEEEYILNFLTEILTPPHLSFKEIKMTLQEQIKKDLLQAIKDMDTEKKNNLRIIIGEFSRGATKVLSDDECVKVLKKLVKSQIELKGILERSGAVYTLRSVNNFLDFLNSYLPKQASDDDIKKWVQNNIDFSKYKNKMQAMKDVMGHFGATVDGNNVKNILQKI